MVHPLKERRLLVNIARVDLPATDEGDGVSEGYCSVSVGPCKCTTRNATRTAPNILDWSGELFMVDEDDLLASNMSLTLEVMAARKWGSDLLIGQADVVLTEAHQEQLLAGHLLPFELPLSKGGSKSRSGSNSSGSLVASAAGGSSSGSSSGGSSSSGVLRVCVILQRPDVATDLMMDGMSPDMAPRLVSDALGMYPGTVMHSPLGTVYVTPCVVYLRFKLLSATGLNARSKVATSDFASGPGGLSASGNSSSSAGGGGNGLGGKKDNGNPLQVLEGVGHRVQAEAGKVFGNTLRFFGDLKARHIDHKPTAEQGVQLQRQDSKPRPVIPAVAVKDMKGSPASVALVDIKSPTAAPPAPPKAPLPPAPLPPPPPPVTSGSAALDELVSGLKEGIAGAAADSESASQDPDAAVQATRRHSLVEVLEDAAIEVVMAERTRSQAVERSGNSGGEGQSGDSDSSGRGSWEMADGSARNSNTQTPLSPGAAAEQQQKIQEAAMVARTLSSAVYPLAAPSGHSISTPEMREAAMLVAAMGGAWTGEVAPAAVAAVAVKKTQTGVVGGGGGGGATSVLSQGVVAGGGTTSTSSSPLTFAAPVQKSSNLEVGDLAAENLMSALEESGFGVSEGPLDVSELGGYYYARVGCEGHHFTSHMVQADSGAVAWSEMFVFAVQRPLPPATFELDLHASGDANSRGKSVCKINAQLDELLQPLLASLAASNAKKAAIAQAKAERKTPQARKVKGEAAEFHHKFVEDAHQEELETEALLAGEDISEDADKKKNKKGMIGTAVGAAKQVGKLLSGKKEKKKPKVKAPPFYDPAFWPRCTITLNGKADDGSAVEVVLEVEAVDHDDRAVDMNLPLLLPNAAAVAAAAAEAGRVLAPATAAASAAAGDASKAASTSVAKDTAKAVQLPTASMAASKVLAAPTSKSAGGATASATATPGGKLLGQPLSSLGPLGQSGSDLAAVAEAERAAAEAEEAAAAANDVANATPGVTLRQSSSKRSNSASATVAEEEQTAAIAPEGNLVGSAAGTSQLAAWVPGHISSLQPLMAGRSAVAPEKLPVALLQLVLHDFEVKQKGDYYCMFQCGDIWGCSTTVTANDDLRASWGWGVTVPMDRASRMLNITLYRRNDSAAGKKVLNVKALVGMAEQCVGKMRLRTNTLTPSKVRNVTLPIHGDRAAGSGRPTGVTGQVHLTLMLSYPPGMRARYLASYLKPEENQGVELLRMGAVPGSETPVPARTLAGGVESEALARRFLRVVTRWLEAVNPPIPAARAKKLLDDGRQEFNLARTQQNWKRIAAAMAVMGPLSEFWVGVRTWNDPWASWFVVACILIFAAWPSRVIALIFLSAAIYIGIYQSHELSETMGFPWPMIEDEQDESKKDDDELSESGSMGGSSYSSNSAVPLDPITNLKQQYEGAAKMMLSVQNTLDAIAARIERWMGLFRWCDPFFGSTFAIFLLVVALLFSTIGIQGIVAVALLWDVRPPFLQDPFKPAPDAILDALPCRSDQLM